jgi:hypothetical protein
MAKKLRPFNRERYHDGSWLLAGSLACPVCCARLRGNKVFAWCEAWHCHFWCYWEEIDEVVHKFNLAHPSTYLKECYSCLQNGKS